MSLINQMLIDLERRGQAASGAAVLNGLGAERPAAERRNNRGLPLVAMLAGSMIVATIVIFDDPDGTAEPRIADTVMLAANSRAPAPQSTNTPASPGNDAMTMLAPPPSERPSSRHTSKDRPPAKEASTSVQQTMTPTLRKRKPENSTTRTLPPDSGLNKRLRPLTRQEQAQQAWQRGQQQLAANDSASARLSLTRAITLAPSMTQARASLAALLINEGRLGEAEELLRDGLSRTTRSPELARLYARLLLHRRQPGEAIDILRTSAPALSADSEYHALLASALLQENNAADAAGIYRRLLQNDPARGTWWLGLAVSLETLGERDRAYHAYQQAARTDEGKHRLAGLIRQRLQRLGHNAMDTSS